MRRADDGKEVAFSTKGVRLLVITTCITFPFVILSLVLCLKDLSRLHAESDQRVRLEMRIDSLEIKVGRLYRARQMSMGTREETSEVEIH